MAGNPFESGKTLVFQSANTSTSNRFMDSDPNEDDRKKQVWLRSSSDYSNHPGTHWAVEKVSSGIYRFISETTSSNRRYLDSNPTVEHYESVYLKDSSAGPGSRWDPKLQANGSYTLQCQNTSNERRYLNGNPSHPSNDRSKAIYLLEDNTKDRSHWNVGVDYFSGREVEKIVQDVYPHTIIIYYDSDLVYGTLFYEQLKDIWDKSGLANYAWKQHKYDDDDFAFSYKAEVSRYSYNQTRPTDKGSLCGVMWGKSSTGDHAYNFSINPYGELLLIEPQFGTLIPHDKYVPYYCFA